MRSDFFFKYIILLEEPGPKQLNPIPSPISVRVTEYRVRHVFSPLLWCTWYLLCMVLHPYTMAIKISLFTYMQKVGMLPAYCVPFRGAPFKLNIEM